MRGRKTGQWLLLLAGTFLTTTVFCAGNLPAALLLGPMLAGIFLGLAGGQVRVGKSPYDLSLAAVGCLIAQTVTPSLLPSLGRTWPLLCGITLATLATSTGLGWLLSRLGLLPGATGLWGTSPGGAMAMVVMADAYGDDGRLVAFMQYLRVLCVAGTAAAVARAWTAAPTAAAAMPDWFPPLSPAGLGTSLGLLGLGWIAGHCHRIPAGALLVPMLAGAALHLPGLADIDPPPWLLAGAYAVIGWKIGLGFTRQVVHYAARALPAILLSIGLLMGFCALLAWGLVRLAAIDPLTAYLATSPGGMDSVAIIAATCTDVDLPCIMSFQTARFVLVVMLAPPLARIMARRLPATGR